MLVAADHPARGSLGVGDDPMAMADREDLLRRLRIALEQPQVDGVLATADILEDLLLMGLLDDKVVIGSMNRGGLVGASFEMDDRFTGCDAPTLSSFSFNGGKMLCRIDLSDSSTAVTLEACGRAVTDLAREGLMALVEPFMTERAGNGVHNDLSPEAVIRAAQIASGLGATSRHTWLKLPVVEGMDRVMRATTLPTLLLGGDPSAAPDEIFATWEKALALPGVRGLVVGRALLYPEDGDVDTMVSMAASLVHGDKEER